jgi:hypothetical protein
MLPLSAIHAAGLAYTINFNTAGLTQGGSYFVDFQFIGDAGNTVTLTDPSYGGGHGDTQTLTMDTISQFFNEQSWHFVAGQFIAFTVQLTNLPPPVGGFPDELSVFLLDQSQTPLPTNDAGGSFVTLDLTGGQPNIQTFQGSGVSVPAVTATPEPAALWLTLIAIAGAIVRQLRRSR